MNISLSKSTLINYVIKLNFSLASLFATSFVAVVVVVAVFMSRGQD
jgi:hypothetical protein